MPDQIKVTQPYAFRQRKLSTAWELAVNATAPNHWLRLGETLGNFRDEIDRSIQSMTIGAGITRGQDSFVAGDTNKSINGANNSTAFIHLNNPLIPPTGNFTFNLWLNDTLDGSRIYIQSITGGETGSFQVRIFSDKILFTVIGSFSARSSILVNSGIHFCSLILDGVNPKVLVDGVDVTANITTGSPTIITTNSTITNFPIPTSNSLDGGLDEIVIHDRAISLAEHISLYNSGI